MTTTYFRKNFIAAAILAFAAISAPVMAAEQLPTAMKNLPPGMVDPNKEAVDAMQMIPSEGFQMVEANGKTFLLSIDGRYMVRGELHDLWSGQTISSVKQLTDTMDRLDFEKVGLDVQELFGLDYGSGDKQVVVFVAPGCPHCHTLMQKMPELASEYTFRLIPLPFMGPESVKHTKQVACAADRYPEEATQALMSENYDLLPVKEEMCDLDGVRKSLISSKILGIKGVPYVVSHDKRVSRGAPRDLKAFLEGGE
ncbi:DsbC family protein [Geoalkalibacter subterraneus]|uniref:Thioredoxin-like fold domain-containing protein n=1 Tax=Geoalkalibacter subterraneus TaxID=483547 RepID=A0A0B5FTW9_9BACT|nr:DsbC family protein [Geoalkalibacter subterraneus]AJF08129.1 hypothetical protein GSUB_16600 [Geoalkalibacter subterraneus]